MADDVTLPGAGAVIAADEVGGKKFQRMKVAHGPDGVASDTTPENPFPVAVQGGALEAVAAALAAPDYEVISPSDTDEMAGGSGAVGDTLYQLLVIPLTTSPGEVSIEDGSTNTVVFAGGADSVSTLIPFTIDLGGIKSASGGWEITTGANVRVVAIGRFT